MASSLVSIAFPPPPRTVYFLGRRTDDFVKNGLGISRLAEHPAQPLLGLARGSGAADHYRHLDFRNIHAFIQDTVGDQGGIDAVAQTFQDLQAFLLAAVVEQARNQEP